MSEDKVAIIRQKAVAELGELRGDRDQLLHACRYAYRIVNQLEATVETTHLADVLKAAIDRAEGRQS